MSNAKGRKLQQNRGGNGRLAHREDEVRKFWKDYFEDLCNIDSQGQVALMGFRKSIGRCEVQVRVGKLKNGKATGKDEIPGEMIKDGDDRVVDGIWRLCNMAFENGVVMESDCPYQPSDLE